MKRTLLANPRLTLSWLTTVLLVALFGLFVALHHEQHFSFGPSSQAEPRVFTVTPAGEGANPLGPIKVTFASPPDEHDGAALMQVSPAVDGSYVWQSDRTVLFQPAYPGLLRGQQYTVDVPARPEAGLNRDVSVSFETEGKLTVDSVIPAQNDVDVPPDVQVLVQFSRSVAPLTFLSTQSDQPVVVFDPPLPGTGEWLNTSLYRFVPDPDAIQPSTHYQARVLSHLSEQPDGVLSSDYVWTFDSYGPAVESVTPGQNTQFVGPNQPIVVRFNQPMDRTSVQVGLQLKGSDGKALQGLFTWSENDSVVSFTPVGDYEPMTRYSLLLPTGLLGANGGSTSSDWQSQFETVGPPAVTSTDPTNGTAGAQRFGASFVFSNPMDEGSFSGRVSINGAAVDDTDLFIDPSGLHLSLGTQLDPSSSYTVALAAGITDRYGQPLPPYTLSFTTGERPSQLDFAIPNSVATYSASTEPILYFHSINMDEATFALYPLTDAEIKGIQTQGYLDNSFEPSQPALYSWTEDVSGAANEVQLKSTSLSRDGGPLPKGNYYVAAMPASAAAGPPGGPPSAAFFRSEMAFSVVDTALITKISFNQLLVWALDLDTGQPVSGLNLQVSGTPSLPTATAMTDSDGLASFAIPSDQTNPFKNPQYVVRSQGGDRYAVTTTQWQQGANPYQLGIPYEGYPRKYVGNVYTDRPIYRAGEQVFYKAVVRADDDAAYSIPTDLQDATLVITDPQGRQLQTSDVVLDEFGALSDSFQLPDDAATGNYNLSIMWTPQPDVSLVIAQVSFQVAEFRTPEFQVDVTTPRQDYVNGDTIDATADASYFFGGGVAGAEVDWSVTSAPYTPFFDGYDRYSFSDYDYYRSNIFEQPLRNTSTGETDNSGIAILHQPANLTGDEGAQRFQISASVLDQSGQAIAGSTTVAVHPASLVAGVRPAEYVATAGQDAEIDLVALDLDGNPQPHTDIDVNVYDRTWVTTKVQTADGARRYDSEPKDTLLTTLHATTDDKGEASVTYTPDKAGTLRIVAAVTDDQGRVSRSATYLWVAGSGFASWQVTNDDSLQLISDKDEYTVGDTAQVLVPAPFEGATGLVTVERGKIISHSVQQFPTNSEQLSIPIDDGSVPDVFVSVVLYRPPTQDDPVARYKVGYVQLHVSTDSRQLNVQVTPDREQAQPGDTVRYDVQVTDANGNGVRSELSAAVVDEAVLSLAAERSITGLTAFWYERGLGVLTASSLAVSVDRANDVISEATAGGKGGGGAEDRLRQDFRNTAFWDGDIVTDGDGKATVDVKLPDNLTTWRMQVRAISGNILVGQGSNDLLSTQPLLLRPALPRFLRVGDQPTLRLLITNATDADANVDVSLEASGIDVTGPLEQTVPVKARGTAVVSWPASVTDEGEASLTFSASGGGNSDAVKQTLPIYLDTTPETTATGGVVTNTASQEAVYIPPFAMDEGGSLSVSVQATLTGSLADDLNDFKPTDWESNDDIAARIIATLAVQQTGGSKSDLPFSDSELQGDVAKLIAQQHGDGGWAWCSRCPNSDPMVTGWVLQALGAWQDAGHKIDLNVINAATRYIYSDINQFRDVERPADPNEKAYLLYSIASAGANTTALSTMRSVVEQDRANLTNWGRAYLLLGFASGDVGPDDPTVRLLLDDLAANVEPSANGNHWEDADKNLLAQTGPRTTALVLTALSRIDPNHPLIEETARWLVVALGTNVCRTQIERAQAVASLAAFAQSTGELGTEFHYNVDLAGSSILAGLLSSEDELQVDQTTIPLAQLKKGAVSILDLARDYAKRGRMYYTMNLRYTTPAQTVDALNRGFAISHEYTALDNPDQPITSAKLGDIVRVTVTVVSDAEHNYVVLDDNLPAGLEAIDPNLQTTDPALVQQLQQERQDANRPANLDYVAPWFAWYYSPWQQTDIRDDRLTVSATRLSKGVYQFIYYARATTPGDFFVAPVHVEETFFPDVFGRSDSSRFTVAP